MGPVGHTKCSTDLLILCSPETGAGTIDGNPSRFFAPWQVGAKLGELQQDMEVPALSVTALFITTPHRNHVSAVHTR